ncbi:MAG: type IV pilus modification protein PilV [Salinisphaeraceae bacterium]
MRLEQGVTLIEILISLLVLSIGLLGLAGLQVSAQQLSMDAYEQERAGLLADYIVERIALNREARQCYGFTDPVTGGPAIGQGVEIDLTCTGFGTIATQELAEADLAAWEQMLEGATETLAGNNVGAMVNARGCIWLDADANTATIAVTWQGEIQADAPPASLCGANQYGDERYRRALIRTLEFADLDA